jgi:hypothetical protein
MVHRLLVIVTAALAAGALVIATAGGAVAAGPKIGPNQLFVGLVNGSSGFINHAQIRVACPGPIRPGELTHPLAHQHVEVGLPVSIAVTVGDTGTRAKHIEAVLGAPPLSTIAQKIATFGSYDLAKAIPTTLFVPCGGTGAVTFLPVPGSASSRPFVVPVDFVNIAV